VAISQSRKNKINNTNKQINPTVDELAKFKIKTLRGIDVGLGEVDQNVEIYKKLEEQYPNHLVLIQAGAFLHGYDRTAHALSVLKKYQVKLIGATSEPHLRVGFGLSNFKRRLWSIVEEFSIPYVVALKSADKQLTIYVSDHGDVHTSMLAGITKDIVVEVINDLKSRGQVSEASTKQLLAKGHTQEFSLKKRAEELDGHLLQDLLKMPRNLRATWGENVRVCMASIMSNVYHYGAHEDKAAVLKHLSADVDLLKHYLSQVPRLSQLKFSFEHRAGLAVELGKLVGGLIRAPRVQP